MTDDREPDRATPDRTTIVTTERRGSGAGIALAVVVLLVLFLLFVFRDQIFGAAQQVEKVDVQVTTNSG